MEKKHSLQVIVISVLVLIVSCILKLEYSLIADSCIDIIAISLAIYTISISALIGSDFAKKLQTDPHPTIPGSSQLDVIVGYIKRGVIIAITTIVVSLLSGLVSQAYIAQLDGLKLKIWVILNGVSFAVLSLNFLFIWFIFTFIINRQLEGN